MLFIVLIKASVCVYITEDSDKESSCDDGNGQKEHIDFSCSSTLSAFDRSLNTPEQDTNLLPVALQFPPVLTRDITPEYTMGTRIFFIKAFDTKKNK